MNIIFSILKKVLIISLVLAFFQKSVFADARYDWASGYKIKSIDSLDNEEFFKSQFISGGDFSQNQNLMSTWEVTQKNWTDSFPKCRTWAPPTCTGEGEYTSPVTFTYKCAGDVSYNLQVSNDANNLVGGDTMYGAWSMLFNYFPPVLDTTNCSQFGRCFVGNAYVLDTKAQKEVGVPDERLWAVGIKGLVEGPGDVFYFDQVRAMTQPPKDTMAKYNNPYLVGNMLPPEDPGGPGGMCDLSVCDSITSMPGGTNAKDLDAALEGLRATVLNPFVTNSDMSIDNFRRCYYYVLTKAKDGGTDPASAAAVWVEESGASYCEKYGMDLKDLGVVMPPYPNIESQATLYSHLLNAYVANSNHASCRAADGSPGSLTVKKYWLIYYGGEDGCTNYFSSGNSAIDGWFDRINSIYMAIHAGSSGLSWGKVLRIGVTNFGN